VTDLGAPLFPAPEIPAPEITAHAITANAIADALGRPRPTPQQRAVIEAPLEPALVVAGAGSGKTETMAGRVLWLLANQLVRPGEILGLTFTRRASGELSARIRERIAALAAVGMLGETYDPFEAPTVSTYNAYANALYRDNSVVLGRESDGAVLGEAAAWQLARSTVTRSRLGGLTDFDKALEPVTRATLSIARGLAENVADPDAIRALVARFRSVVDLPAAGKYPYADVDKIAETVGALDTLVGLAAEYDAAKARRGLVEYSDQVALALMIISLAPAVAALEREKYRVVLLDEYQDTSVVQARLLATLFAGHPVMAVGDPNQSIYGWRGASASNLDEFARSFGSGDARYALTTSWRNGRHILDAANSIVAPFAGGRGGAGRVSVERLEPSSTATDIPVDLAFENTVIDEANAAASWLKVRIAEGYPRDGKPASAAILFRTRKMQGYFLEAMRQADVPFHVLGIGGLMAEPEIADLVCALTVVQDPSAGLELIRLLAGSRWRIGVQDLHALNRLASWLRDRDYAQHRYDNELAAKLRTSVTEGEGGSIVDALDFLAHAREDHLALSGFSALGIERLRDAGRTLARMRSRSALQLPDFAAFVLQELQLDIEVAANDFRALGSATVDAFFDAMNNYLAIDEMATLGGFLSWLHEAELREDLTPRPEDPEPGTVQVLTIHGAKGLEWDAVVVPRLVDKELPGEPVEGGYLGWLSFGVFPWPFRGDAAELPVFHWESATTRKELLDERDRFKARVRDHLGAEERRLAYVAVTRARHSLLLTGSSWATQKDARKPSIFLRELSEADIIGALPSDPVYAVNPLGDKLERLVWPLDPLGTRRDAVENAARAVRVAEPMITGPWSRDLELLVEERRARMNASGLVAMPTRVPASRFKDYVNDPASVASSLRRPMPEKPYRATQLGTLFHSWVENRSGAGGDADELDAAATELDIDDVIDDSDVQLEHLKAIFKASPWANRLPVDVEREIHLPFDGRIVICKIDAVYAAGDRYEIVDWKTGKSPTDAKDLEEKQLQLALYRLAWAKWKGIEPELIDAVFYYVADNLIIRPTHIYDEAELLARWRAAVS
jgi:DNA helicase-2/ATP-dependent DNA helicase PcrA